MKVKKFMNSVPYSKELERDAEVMFMIPGYRQALRSMGVEPPPPLLELAEQRRSLERLICSAFGIPARLLGR